MEITTQGLNSYPVNLAIGMFAVEYRKHLPSILTALGACAGFASQMAVWGELIEPNKRNPGDFVVSFQTTSGETFIFGESINLFLFATMPDRLSFASVAGALLGSTKNFPDITELLRHVSSTLGGESFGRPRFPRADEVADLPRAALNKTWTNIRGIFERDQRRPGEWPTLLGAAAHRIMNTYAGSFPPALALKILFESAVPMSKLHPITVQDSGFTYTFASAWSKRTMDPSKHEEIVAEVRNVMPTGLTK